MEDEDRFVFDYPDNIDKYISDSCVSNYIKITKKPSVKYL